MLRFLGVPVIQAPGEAEAQCASLTRSQDVYAVVTEDMDALTFGAKHLLRNFKANKDPVIEINYMKMLSEL